MVEAMAAAAEAKAEAEERLKKAKGEATMEAEMRKEEEPRTPRGEVEMCTMWRKEEEGREAKAERTVKAGEKAESTDISKMKMEDGVKQETEEKRVRKPNAGNGLDLENYFWTQQLSEVHITVPIPQGIKSRLVICEIMKNHLKVGLKGYSLIIDGELYQPVKVEECFWSIEDGNTLSMLLTKQDRMVCWKSVIKGDPEVDIRMVKPTSKLSDLDPETRETIERTIIDCHRKAMGLPTSDEIQKQNLIKNLIVHHPHMDFSKAKMS